MLQLTANEHRRDHNLLEEGTVFVSSSSSTTTTTTMSIEFMIGEGGSSEEHEIILLPNSTTTEGASHPETNTGTVKTVNKNTDYNSLTGTTTTTSIQKYRRSRESLADSVTTRESSSESSSNSSSIDEISCSSLGKRKEKTTTADADTKQDISWSMKWTRFVNRSRQPVNRLLQALTQMSTKHPKQIIVAIGLLSLVLLTIGLTTNFRVEVQEATLWTPMNSPPAQHSQWIIQDSGFAPIARSFVLYFHAKGNNVLGKEQVSRVFHVLNSLQSLKDYNTVCASGGSDDTYLDNGEEASTTLCEIYGITRFWNNTMSMFEQEIISNDEEDVIMAMSSLVFADGIPAAQDQIFGRPKREYSTGLLTSAQAYMITIQFPPTTAAEDFEAVVIDTMQGIREAWEQEDGSNDLRLEVMAQRSLSDEYTRAIYADLPLIPLAFIIMTVFTSLVFTKRHKVHSRSLLGLGAVVSVLLSIVSAFGFMFLCGVPFSPVTQLLPFVMFGIGLDDAFVIMGAWLRGGHHEKDSDPIERMRKTIDEIGLSITLTSITSALAFALGCLSSIPGIFWLCLYAVPTIIFIFLYQLTFFVACIVLDERRIQQNRRDCCICIVATTSSPVVDGTIKNEQGDSSPDTKDHRNKNETVSLENAMKAYANWLLRPWVKVSCLIGFTVLAVLCAWSTSKMNQEFKFTDVLPQGSYATAFMNSYATYSSDIRNPMFIYFRNIDQSDAIIQQQMQNYVTDLGHLDKVQDKPDFFWLDDFLQFTNQVSQIDSSSLFSANSTFIEELDTFLSIPMYSTLYSAHLVRDDHGSLKSSRCATFLTNFEAENVQSQIDALHSQRAVSKRQPINNNINGQQEEEDWPFLTYSSLYDMWEFYSILVDELIVTSLCGIAAVTIVALFFIPHWSAAPLVLPLVIVLYIDLLGVMQWAGVHLNAVSYITLVMSIGLTVDYIMHVLLRYYEVPGNRHEKTVEMLQTMGTSILLGGTSTLLGTLPLVLSTSAVFRTVFIAFVGFTTLGLAHGLVVLPIILSMIGSEEETRMNA